MTTSAREPRGFTIVEMLMAVAVTAVVSAGAFVLLASQQRAFRSSAGRATSAVIRLDPATR